MSRGIMFRIFIFVFCVVLLACPLQVAARQTQPPLVKPQFDEWTDDFSGDKLDDNKWEKFTFEGGSGGKIEVKNGEVQIRSAAKTRAGIRTRTDFTGDRFIAEAHLAKVGPGYPEQ